MSRNRNSKSAGYVELRFSDFIAIDVDRFAVAVGHRTNKQSSSNTFTPMHHPATLSSSSRANIPPEIPSTPDPNSPGYPRQPEYPGAPSPDEPGYPRQPEYPDAPQPDTPGYPSEPEYPPEPDAPDPAEPQPDGGR